MKKNTLDPIWDQLLHIKAPLSSLQAPGTKLHVRVYDKDRITKNDYLGSFSLPVSGVHHHVLRPGTATLLRAAHR